MVFCETKKDVDLFSMCDDIKQNKEKLHGDVKQETRERVLEVGHVTISIKSCQTHMITTTAKPRVSSFKL